MSRSELLDAFEPSLRSILQRARQKKWDARERYGDSWAWAHEPEYYLRRAQEEFMEFRQAVEHDRDKQQAISELADVLNYSTMYLLRAFHDRDGDPE